MRTISLWQPWASAIALGHKHIETRHWTTAYRGPLAIHAAMRWDREQREFHKDEFERKRMPEQIPLGAIVATCVLIDVKTTEELESIVNPIEHLYGNYENGRYGWILDNIVALPEPIPYKGAQGFFHVPDDLFK